MDIVTHMLMGAALAYPFLNTHPFEATAFAFGCVLPDLDSFSRLFGKRVFMKSHQTYSHALPIIAVIAASTIPLFLWLEAPPIAALFLGLGMTFHSLLDVSNTFGIALFLPFSKRRFSMEWVFFIDAVVIAATLGTLASFSKLDATGPWLPVLGYMGVLGLYWVLKAVLRHRAGTLSPDGTLSLIPSALWPWRFLGCQRKDQSIVTFDINALSGKISNQTTLPILDAEQPLDLTQLAEYRVMLELSPAYHVVECETEEGETRLRLRDLRTRNFSTRFGELDITCSPEGEIKDLVFHV